MLTSSSILARSRKLLQTANYKEGTGSSLALMIDLSSFGKQLTVVSQGGTLDGEYQSGSKRQS
jgi:hypothetical protein